MVGAAGGAGGPVLVTPALPTHASVCFISAARRLDALAIASASCPVPEAPDSGLADDAGIDDAAAGATATAGAAAGAAAGMAM